MANADQQETSRETPDANASPQGNNNKIETELAEVRGMLERMNQSFEAQAAANVAASKKTVVEEIDPVYDSKGYRAQLLDEADKIAQRAVTRERELNSVVYDLSTKYPEISTDANLKKAIQAAQNRLPESMRGSAAGYKAAILEAVSEAGLIPKNKRQADLDPDVSMGSGQGGANSTPRKGKAKLSQDSIDFAEALGMNIEDPKVLAGLEKAAQRTKWSKYE